VTEAQKADGGLRRAEEQPARAGFANYVHDERDRNQAAVQHQRALANVGAIQFERLAARARR
jgi:hypothetical protein